MSPEEKRELYSKMYGSWENVPEKLKNQIESDEETYTDESEVPEEKDQEMELPDLKGYGSMVSSISQVAAATGNIINTLGNKPQKQENFFARYAEDALQKTNEMKVQAKKIRDLKLGDMLMSERGQRSRNRASSRSINTMRALDLGTHAVGLSERRKITGDYETTLMNLGGKEIDISLDRDRMRMGGAERRADKYEASRDAYGTAISQNIMDLGRVGGHIGAEMNKERSSEMAWQIAGNIGKYGSYLDYVKYFMNTDK